MDKLVARWHEVVTNEDITGAWTKRALPYTISGFNVFIKFGMGSNITCPGTGTTTAAFDVTYTLGLPASDARLYAYNGTAYTDITPTEGLEAGKDKTASVTLDTAGDYTIFIADSATLVEGDTPPQAYQAITCYSRDIVNGVAKPAEITIS